MAKQKYYAVKVGKNVGVNTSWSECEKQVKGYPGAVYKSFEIKETTEEFVAKISDIQPEKDNSLNFRI